MDKPVKKGDKNRSPRSPTVIYEHIDYLLSQDALKRAGNDPAFESILYDRALDRLLNERRRTVIVKIIRTRREDGKYYSHKWEIRRTLSPFDGGLAWSLIDSTFNHFMNGQQQAERRAKWRALERLAKIPQNIYRVIMV